MDKFGTRVIASGVESVVRKLRMKWHSRYLVDKFEERLAELKDEFV